MLVWQKNLIMYEDRTVMKAPEMCFVAKKCITSLFKQLCCLVANLVFQPLNHQYFLSEWTHDENTENNMGSLTNVWFWCVWKSLWQAEILPCESWERCPLFPRPLAPKSLEIHFGLIRVWLVCWDVCRTDNLSTPVHASATKAPLARPDGLFGRGLLVGPPPVPLLADSAASDNVAGCAGVRTPGLFAFFFFLGLRNESGVSRSGHEPLSLTAFT